VRWFAKSAQVKPGESAVQSASDIQGMPSPDGRHTLPMYSPRPEVKGVHVWLVEWGGQESSFKHRSRQTPLPVPPSSITRARCPMTQMRVRLVLVVLLLTSQSESVAHAWPKPCRATQTGSPPSATEQTSPSGHIVFAQVLSSQAVPAALHRSSGLHAEQGSSGGPPSRHCPLTHE
jgi:hypothetical protein